MPIRSENDPLQQGSHSRGYLPHRKVSGATYFVTFRLADSLPRTVLQQFMERHQILALAPCSEADRAEALRVAQRREIEHHLDRGTGACHLRRVEIARWVIETLRHFNGQRYELHEWVVMPNHVHVLLTPSVGHSVSDIIKSWKQYVAVRANRELGSEGCPFWQRESYDHWVRNPVEFERIAHYIRQNPVKAGLCSQAEHWPWSSVGSPAWSECPPVPQASKPASEYSRGT